MSVLAVAIFCAGFIIGCVVIGNGLTNIGEGLCNIAKAMQGRK